ncbi:MAG: hypothetical protein Fur0035_16650 [Anaerolineales bacterium]
MNNDFPENSQAAPGDERPAPQTDSTNSRPAAKASWLEALARLGLGETVLRAATGILSLFAIVIVVGLTRTFFRDTPAAASGGAQPTATPAVQSSPLKAADPALRAIAREAQIHTIIPNRPRTEISTYIVQKGDTVTSIAEKFNLNPRTILNSNAFTRMADDPHNLSIGQEVYILPVDGVYWQWQSGESLTAWAKTFQVKVEDIINYPANHLDPATLGDYGNPNIKPGTMLVIPGGYRLPNARGDVFVGVTRDHPAIARVQGAGACESVSDGAVGIGSFIWPANKHYLSGYDWSPDSGHRGIDIAGDTGEPVYAVDYGVIVYAGWNDWGYGNMVMVDHGNGWQSLYAHLSAINVLCGQSVLQGTVIGAIGSTGNSSGSHLHFELMHTLYSKVNPWLYLPPP